MTLTAAEKERILLQYVPYIRSRVGAFYQKMPARNRNDYEDFLQEAMLSFLVLMDRVENEQELKLRAALNIHHDLFEYVRRMDTVAIPHNRYMRHRGDFTRCSDDIHDMEAYLPSSSLDDTMAALELESALNNLPVEERTALCMVCAHRSNKEIRSALHMTNDTAVTRLLQRAKAHLAQQMCWESMLQERE